MHKNKGFTLAEVLITLGVIGVIAAITMPLVIQNYQKQRTVSKLKKAYTVLNQALKMSEVDNGPHEYWERFESLNDEQLKLYIEKYFEPYLKVTKVCNNSAQCGYKSSWQNANNTASADKAINYHSLILSDGIFVMFSIVNQRIFVDLNAGEKPNRYGRDLFVFQLNNKGIYPYGFSFSSAEIKYTCKKTNYTVNNGITCAAKIMKDGWKIASDYPW